MKPTHRHTRLRAAVPALALTLALAACGGDDAKPAAGKDGKAAAPAAGGA
ncbi:MAG: hypothetical protein JWM27_2982, partial [Gemmatimonadetes bacterium]|nr:hypothetical protein [Gemmatimonadota bacterium]